MADSNMSESQTLENSANQGINKIQTVDCNNGQFKPLKNGDKSVLEATNEPMDVDATDDGEEDEQITSSSTVGITIAPAHVPTISTVTTTSTDTEHNQQTACALVINQSSKSNNEKLSISHIISNHLPPSLSTEAEKKENGKQYEEVGSQSKVSVDQTSNIDSSMYNVEQSVSANMLVERIVKQSLTKERSEFYAAVSATANSEADSVTEAEEAVTTSNVNSIMSIENAVQSMQEVEEIHKKKNEAPINDAGIVDLGDESDEGPSISKADSQSDRNVQMDDLSKPDAAVESTTQNSNPNKKISSEEAVVIGSDSSDNEMETSQENANQQLEQSLNTITVTKIPSANVEHDDDDDDCVLIEDDTPVCDVSELSKRKNFSMDSGNTSDDSQPPLKKPCALNSNDGSLSSSPTTKSARLSLPNLETTTKKTSEVYPVNLSVGSGIIPTQANVTSMPRLVPVSGSSVNNTTGIMNFNVNNTTGNLLPGLTDDMFVLEAPSFIVPYIYEKPSGNALKIALKELAAKFKFTREDLAEVDKTDEFDLTTEQNKEVKSDKKSGKKKRKRVGDGDESWSEESEEEDDDDDDDSDSATRTKVLIKEASDDLTTIKGAIKPVSSLVTAGPNDQLTQATNGVKPSQVDSYFESSLGKFFMDLGVGFVQEYVQNDLIRLQKRKMRKSLGKNTTEIERTIAALSGNLEASQKKNKPYKFTQKRCEFCNFKSESVLAMANHYETPHMNGVMYKCNFCTFEIRNATEIVYHMEAMHNIKARLIKPLPYHQCPNCAFEDNGKAKLARHQPVCAKKYRPELNLAPPNDWEDPAKIPRIKPRHGLVGTATAYQAMAAQAAAQKAALASIQAQQVAVQARNIQAAALASQTAAANKMRGRPASMMTTKTGGVPSINNINQGSTTPIMRTSTPIRNNISSQHNVSLGNNYQFPSGLVQQVNASNKKNISGQPSISITPLPRQSSSQSSSSSGSKTPAGMKPGQHPNQPINKSQFVICEVCDGYIKNLEELRNHMQWMHKVKIHPKMIYNRPPLNCQKCQFRFFTDQGLERHLLGSHGLVTSSMQEAANKGKDCGRCPVCGRLYQWKLLNHVSRDHHMTLKPAHLSYKCTVCTATFGMYKQFETHVYTAHSTVAKKAMDGKKNNQNAMGPSSSSNSRNSMSGFSTSNESLLKPLKINDEITIIPQPSAKPRITNMESHVID